MFLYKITTNGYIHMNEYSKEYDSIIKNLQKYKK